MCMTHLTPWRAYLVSQGKPLPDHVPVELTEQILRQEIAGGVYIDNPHVFHPTLAELLALLHQDWRRIEMLAHAHLDAAPGEFVLCDLIQDIAGGFGIIDGLFDPDAQLADLLCEVWDLHPTTLICVIAEAYATRETPALLALHGQLKEKLLTRAT